MAKKKGTGEGPDPIADLGTPPEKKKAGEVVIPAAFAGNIDEDTLARLKGSGAMLDGTADFEALTLPEPGPGETVIDELSPQEKAVYVALSQCSEKLEDITRAVGGDAVTRVGQAIKNAEEKEFDPAKDADPEQLYELFRLERQKTYLHSLFWWDICERNTCHDYAVGVRSRGRIVKRDRKW